MLIWLGFFWHPQNNRRTDTDNKKIVILILRRLRQAISTILLQHFFSTLRRCSFLLHSTLYCEFLVKITILSLSWDALGVKKKGFTFFVNKDCISLQTEDLNV